MIIHFTATKDFFSPETQSHYIEGLHYRVTPDNKKLWGLVSHWTAQGLVKTLIPASRIAGVGTVTNKEAA